MTREEVVRLAEQAGAKITSYGFFEIEADELERFADIIEQHLIQSGYRKCAVGQRTTQYCGMAEQARREEREACAMEAEYEAARWTYAPEAREPCESIVKAIRARGNDE